MIKTRNWRILAVAGTALLALLIGVLIWQYRTQTIQAAGYEEEASRDWSAAVSADTEFSTQIIGMKPDRSSVPAVCHQARVDLQRLNEISLYHQTPPKYQTFNNNFLDAVESNKQYYRQVLKLCAAPNGDTSTALAELSALSRTTEDKYREAHNMMPNVGNPLESGTLSDATETLSKVFQPKKAEAPPPRIVPVPRPYPVPVPRPAPEPRTREAAGFAPGNPPIRGESVVVDTPMGGGLNFRTGPSRFDERIIGRELLPQGEILTVISRDGDWLYVRTIDRYQGFVRWYKDGDTYVSPD